MAVVGTAYVVIKAITKGLDKSIEKAADDAVKKAAPGIEKASEDLGDSVGKGVAKGVEDAAPEIKKSGEKAGDAAGKGVEKGMRGTAPDLDRASRDIGERAVDGMSRTIVGGLAREFRTGLDRKIRPHVKSFGVRMTKWLEPDKNGRNAGARFGHALATRIKKFKFPPLLALAGIGLPLIGGAIKIISSYLAATISLASALGPALAGGALVAASSYMALGTAVGAVMLALKTKSPMLTRFQEVSKAIGKEWQTVGISIQKALLPALGNAMTRVTTSMLPLLRAGLTETGKVVGRIAKQFATLTESPAFQGRFANVMAGNNIALGFFGTALTKLADSAFILLSAARPLTEAFGRWVAKLATAANLSLQTSERTGKLARFMEKAGTVSRQLGRIFHNTFAGLIDILKASVGPGQTLLDRIEAISKKFSDWTGSVKGQSVLKAWFQSALPVVHEVNGLIGDLLRLLGKNMISNNSGTVAFLQSLRTEVVPALASMVGSLSNAGPGFAALVASFADLIAAMANSGAIGAFTNALQTVFGVLAALIRTPFLGTILGWAFSFLAFAKAVSFIPGFGKILEWLGKQVFAMIGRIVMQVLVPAFYALAAALGVSVGWLAVIVAAIAALVVGVIWAYNNVDWFRNAVDKVWEAIAAGAYWMWEQLQNVWAWFQETALPIIKSVFGWIRDNVVPILVNLGKFVGAVLVGYFKAWWAVLQTVFGWIRTYVIPVVQKIWEVLVGVGKFVGGVLVGYFKIWWGIVSWIFRAVWGLAQIAAAMIGIAFKWVLNVATTVWNAVWGVISWVFQAVLGVAKIVLALIAGVFRWLLGVASAIWNKIWTVISAVWGWISARARTIGAAIGGVFQSIWSTAVRWFTSVKTFISGIWSAISGGVERALRPIKATFKTIYDRVVEVWSGLSGVLGGVWDNVVSGIQSAFGTVKGWINSNIIDKVNTIISALNSLPGGGGIPSLGYLAMGGTVLPTPGGSLAMLAEAGRPERVEPLDPSGLSQRDRALIEMLSGGGAVPDVRVFIGDQELRGIVRVEVDRKQKAAARDSVYSRVGVGVS